MKVFSRCGMRCDLCLVYRPNVEACDRRAEICAVWRKIMPDFSADPATVLCDGCRCDHVDAVLFDPQCKARQCVLSKGLSLCGDCPQYPCAIFPAEPTQEELQQKIDVEQQWTWEEESLMAAYNCKQYMDEYRRKKLPHPSET